MRIRIELVMVVLLLSFLPASAQTRYFTRDDIEYTLALPSPWQPITRVDVHDHFEFVCGDDVSNGYLHLRKIVVEPGTTAADLFRRDEKLEFQHLAGYVVCSKCEGENFRGDLDGVVFAYEYVSGGKPMYGRIYYLQVDKRTFYSMRFTVARSKMPAIRDQIDMMARSFRLK